MLEVAVIVVALAVGAFLKGATGGGLPQIAIPIMATFLGVERAVIVMAIPGVVANSWMVWSTRDALRLSRDLPSLLVSGVVGAVAGTFLLESLDSRVLSLALACVIIVYVVLATRRPGFSVSARVSRLTSPPVGLAAGGMQGATGISGPLLSTYLHGFGLVPRAYVFSLSVMFLVFSLTQTLTLFGIGLYPAERVVESLLALIPIAVMLPLGSRLASRLSPDAFRRVILVLLSLTAAKLLYDALLG